ncbi:secreted, membrane-associated protein [Cryptosporidium felis]|nr:secreted, membrane-associated protein [Cryptosporidium felis]
MNNLKALVLIIIYIIFISGLTNRGIISASCEENSDVSVHNIQNMETSNSNTRVNEILIADEQNERMGCVGCLRSVYRRIRRVWSRNTGESDTGTTENQDGSAVSPILIPEVAPPLPVSTQTPTSTVQLDPKKLLMELLEYHISFLVILEYGAIYLNFKKLIHSDFWQNTHEMKKYSSILTVIFEVWDNRSYLLVGVEYKLAKLFQSKFDKKKRSYIRVLILGKWLLDCNHIKKSISILILIFYTASSFFRGHYLLFLLICSFGELSQKSYPQALDEVMLNINEMGVKIQSLGGQEVKKIIQLSKSYILEYSSHENLPTQIGNLLYPLDFTNFSSIEFGYTFCLSLLEMYLINLRLTIENLLFFFGSILNLAVEVFLAIDIVMMVNKYTRDLDQTMARIIYDEAIFEKIIRRMKMSHNVDLTEMKVRFNECMENKRKYRELQNLILKTDFLLAASQR